MSTSMSQATACAVSSGSERDVRTLSSACSATTRPRQSFCCTLALSPSTRRLMGSRHTGTAVGFESMRVAVREAGGTAQSRDGGTAGREAVELISNADAGICCASPAFRSGGMGWLGMACVLRWRLERRQLPRRLHSFRATHAAASR